MNTLSLAEASIVYDCAAEASIDLHRVTFPKLTSYIRSLKQLRITLVEQAGDDPWPDVLQRAEWYQFRVCSAALPFRHPALGGAAILAELQQLLARVRHTSPDYAPPAELLLSELGALLQLRENPLLERMAELLDYESPDRVAILVRHSRLIQPMQDEITAHPAFEGMEVVHASELQGASRFDRLFVVGATSWYEDRDYIFTAPRARQIDVLRYSFVRDPWKPASDFPRPQSGGRHPWSARVKSEGSVDLEQVDIEPYRPDVQDLLRRIAPADPKHHELVDATLISLEGDEAVFLDADEDSSALVIDLQSDARWRVRRIQPVTSVEPGMFLLLRTEGGGDYVVPVADRLLGVKASLARKAQALWKRQLRSKVETHGIARVAEELTARGSTRAGYQNVRNWISYRYIKTQDYNDFLAIMRYIGYEPRAGEFWDLMTDIRRAHTKAGHHIRSLLLGQVAHADLARLLREGVMDFEIPGEEGGTLTAYRVENITSETYPVPPSHLGQPFQAGARTWHE